MKTTPNSVQIEDQLENPVPEIEELEIDINENNDENVTENDNDNGYASSVSLN